MTRTKRTILRVSMACAFVGAATLPLLFVLRQSARETKFLVNVQETLYRYHQQTGRWPADPGAAYHSFVYDSHEGRDWAWVRKVEAEDGVKIVLVDGRQPSYTVKVLFTKVGRFHVICPANQRRSLW